MLWKIVRGAPRRTLNSAKLISLRYSSSSSAADGASSSPREKSYVSRPGSRPLLPTTMGRLVEDAAKRWEDTTAYVSSHQNIRKTFGEFHSDSDRLAAGLLSLGLERGDRVGIWGPNTYEWILTMFAAAKAGLILVNINPAYQPKELLYCLNKVGVSALVSSEFFKTQNYYEMVREIAPEVGAGARAGDIRSDSVKSLRHLIMISEKEHEGAFKFGDVANDAAGSDDLKKLDEVGKRIQMDDAVNIQFTSGTTGNPKGACLSHHNLVNNGYFVGLRLGYDEKPHTVCLPVPLYHCFGSVCGVIAMVAHGGACVMPSPSFDPAAAVAAVGAEKCTSLYGTPTMFVDMLASLNAAADADVSTLETGLMAGSPCPQELCKQVIQHMNMKRFGIAYGLTETSPVSFQSFPTDSDEIKTSTIGYPQDHIEAKVVDSEGNVTPAGVPGELCTRGYSTMLGYWEDEAKTKEAITEDRWFHTGDQAVIYPSGYCQIVGRIKEMVIRGGENIYPREIEEALHEHPAVAEAQVVGVPDPRMGEELCAWIRTNNGGDLTEKDVKKFCKGKIAHFKIPRYIRFVDSYPTTVTGKIQKFKMRQESVELFGLQEN